MYLGTIKLMKTYPVLFAAIGGRDIDGMDVGGAHQMTSAIYRTPLGTPGSFSLFGTLGLFFLLQYIYMYQ
jgi:hypothetical protein